MPFQTIHPGQGIGEKIESESSSAAPKRLRAAENGNIMEYKFEV